MFLNMKCNLKSLNVSSSSVVWESGGISVRRDKADEVIKKAPKTEIRTPSIRDPRDHDPETAPSPLATWKLIWGQIQAWTPRPEKRGTSFREDLHISVGRRHTESLNPAVRRFAAGSRGAEGRSTLCGKAGMTELRSVHLFASLARFRKSSANRYAADRYDAASTHWCLQCIKTTFSTRDDWRTSSTSPGSIHPRDHAVSPRLSHFVRHLVRHLWLVVHRDQERREHPCRHKDGVISP